MAWQILISLFLLTKWEIVYYTSGSTPSGGGSYAYPSFDLQADENYLISFSTNKNINFYLFKEIEFYKWKAKEAAYAEISLKRYNGAIIHYVPKSTGKYVAVFLVPGIFSTEREYHLNIIKGDYPPKSYLQMENKEYKFLFLCFSFSTAEFLFKGTQEDTIFINSKAKLHPVIYTYQRGGWIKSADFEPDTAFSILLKPGEKLKVSTVSGIPFLINLGSRYFFKNWPEEGKQ